MTLFQRNDVLDVQLVANKHVRLHSDNGLDLQVRSGWNDIKSCEIRVRPMTGGLRLLIAKAELADDATKFAKAPEAGAIFLDAISPNSCATVQFPYSMEHDLGDVSVKIEATYVTTAGETFYLAKSVTVPVSLAVGVQVQDVFKHNALFARFNVSTASPSPLRLHKAELQGCELFESSFGAASSHPITVFPKQPATLLYKVTRKADAQTPAAPLARTMALRLEYSVLQLEVESLIQQSVTEDLDSPFAHVVAAQVLAEAKAGLQAYDLERAALTGYVTTAYLENASWAPKLHGLSDANRLVEHITSWQKAHPRLKLPPASAASSILIPVEITSVFVVHTADMRINNSALATVHETSVASVNQVIPATLHLRWTRWWDTTSAKKQDEEFSYEVTAPSDAWLIGGRRKGHFVIPGGSDVSSPETEAFIPLVLIPQREGHLAYPSVEIKEIDGAAPCEVDWRNLGETVRVVNRREAVTVSLDASGPAGGPLVLEGR